MYCRNCGKKLPEKSEFCAYCGEALATEDVSSAKTEVIMTAECPMPSDVLPKKKSKLPLIIGVVAFVVTAPALTYFSRWFAFTVPSLPETPYAGMSPAPTYTASVLEPAPPATPEPIAVAYPGPLTIDTSWETTGIKGYTFWEDIKLWEPVKSGVEFLHPAGKGLVIPAYGEDIWVIPFIKSLNNTTKNFGAAPYRHVINTASFTLDDEAYDLPLYIYTDTNSVSLDADYYEEKGLAYFETAIFSSSEVKISKPNTGWYSRDNSVLEEETSLITRGFYLFHEPQPTPNRPQETDDEYFWNKSFTYHTEYHGIGLFAGVVGTNPFSSNVWFDQTQKAVAFLRKNAGGKLILTTSTSWTEDTLAGSSLAENEPNYSLEELLQKIYDGVDNSIQLPASLSNIRLSEDMGSEGGADITYYVGAEGIPFTEGIASEPMISTEAYSVVLLRMADNADIEDAKKRIKDNIDPAKWICVRVDPTDVIVDNIGNLVIIIMCDGAEKIHESFLKLSE